MKVLWLLLEIWLFCFYKIKCLQIQTYETWPITCPKLTRLSLIPLTWRQFWVGFIGILPRLFVKCALDSDWQIRQMDIFTSVNDIFHNCSLKHVNINIWSSKCFVVIRVNIHQCTWIQLYKMPDHLPFPLNSLVILFSVDETFRWSNVRGNRVGRVN